MQALLVSSFLPHERVCSQAISILLHKRVGKPKSLKKCMKLNWNLEFQSLHVTGISVGEVWVFSRTTCMHCAVLNICLLPLRKRLAFPRWWGLCKAKFKEMYEAYSGGMDFFF